jgi:hypothetical protein
MVKNAYFLIFKQNVNVVRSVRKEKQSSSIFIVNKRPRGHIAHLTHTGQFSLTLAVTYKNSFLYCGPTLPLGAMALYETHFCISTGNFYVNLIKFHLEKGVALDLYN